MQPHQHRTNRSTFSSTASTTAAVRISPRRRNRAARRGSGEMSSSHRMRSTCIATIRRFRQVADGEKLASPRRDERGAGGDEQRRLHRTRGARSRHRVQVISGARRTSIHLGLCKGAPITTGHLVRHRWRSTEFLAKPDKHGDAASARRLRHQRFFTDGPCGADRRECGLRRAYLATLAREYQRARLEVAVAVRTINAIEAWPSRPGRGRAAGQQRRLHRDDLGAMSHFVVRAAPARSVQARSSSQRLHR